MLLGDLGADPGRVTATRQKTVDPARLGLGSPPIIPPGRRASSVLELRSALELLCHGLGGKLAPDPALYEVGRDAPRPVFSGLLLRLLARELLVVEVPELPQTPDHDLHGLMRVTVPPEPLAHLALGAGAVAEQVQRPRHRERPLPHRPGLAELLPRERGPLPEAAFYCNARVELGPGLPVDGDPGPPPALAYARDLGHAGLPTGPMSLPGPRPRAPRRQRRLPPPWRRPRVRPRGRPRRPRRSGCRSRACRRSRPGCGCARPRSP